jgi:hypothetical protein
MDGSRNLPHRAQQRNGLRGWPKPLAMHRHRRATEQPPLRHMPGRGSPDAEDNSARRAQFSPAARVYVNCRHTFAPDLLLGAPTLVDVEPNATLGDLWTLVAARSNMAPFIEAWALAPTGIVDIQDLSGSCSATLRLDHRVSDAARRCEVFVYLVFSQAVPRGSVYEDMRPFLQSHSPPDFFYKPHAHLFDYHPYPNQPDDMHAVDSEELRRHLSMHSDVFGEPVGFDQFAAPSVQDSPRLQRCATSYAPQPTLMSRMMPQRRRFVPPGAVPSYCAPYGASRFPNSGGGMYHLGIPSWMHPLRFILG